MTETVSGTAVTGPAGGWAVPENRADLPGRPDGTGGRCSGGGGKRHNSDVEWGDFDSCSYWRKNYSSLREDDREIIRIVGSFFRGCSPGPGDRRRSGVDVGAGTNMYPTLAMLPWTERVHLFDQSTGNVKWLRSEISDLGSSWRPFWSEFCATGYEPDDFGRVRAEVACRADVERRSVFDLPEGAFDIGTMFFVAESMTDDEEEFEAATEKFVRSLRPRSPFAAAFMDSSNGYFVGNAFFPAVHEVTRDKVQEVLTRLVARDGVRVHDIGIPSDAPLREGYEGMIVAVGRIGGKPDP